MYIDAEHLDTPRNITDTNGNLVWQWNVADPFGANSLNEKSIIMDKDNLNLIVTRREKMLTWNQLHQNLGIAVNRHNQLTSKFERFAGYIKEQATAEGFHIKGIEVELNNEHYCFTISFVGRTLYFVFKTILKEAQGTLVGNVRCYLKNNYPNDEFIELGKFDFNGSGETTFILEDENIQASIEHDIHALRIALHFIHESLMR
jgi:hypothetical protein